MKSITLKLNLSEIIYDVQNKTYLTGRSCSDGSNHSHVAHIQANDDEENAAQILRSITMAWAVLRNRLAEFIEEGGTTASNESLTQSEEMLLQLNMPSNFNTGVTNALGEAAHQFIVATAISDWFAITAKGETSDYTGVAKESLAVLEEAVCKRVRPERPSKN